MLIDLLFGKDFLSLSLADDHKPFDKALSTLEAISALIKILLSAPMDFCDNRNRLYGCYPPLKKLFAMKS